ncbi:MAG TPA: glycosyltransferase family 39 protein [Clostridia bacterium]|nr:glycosyltransferase family 39 protein [Clostridia bacterium]
MNFYLIGNTGFGNAYYAAAIRSMTQSFHNFFFVSFDPAGVVSVDKPPVGMWVQAIFALIFGYHGWAMLLPQALAGAGSSLLMYILTTKYFGRLAGLVAALAFALTPAAVVASRNNTMDMQLVFVLLAATWYLFKAIEKEKWRFLFAAAVLIGVGFNVKMLQAYLILPAAAVTYLIFSQEKISRRIIGSIISLVIVLAVSLSWVLAVDFTPAENRPYVGSSTDNTVMELIIGHNGLERLYGRGGSNSRANSSRTRVTPDDGQLSDGNTKKTRIDDTNGGQSSKNINVSKNKSMPQTRGGSNLGANTAGGRNNGTASARSGGGGAGNNIGTAGPLRLWSSNLYGQISWLLVFAMIGILACIRKFNIRRLTVRQGVWFYWVVWLATTSGFFSFAGYFHRYYLCMIAPGLAALVGIGFSAMVRAYRTRDNWRQWLLPLSLIATVTIAAIRVWDYPEVRGWLVPTILIFAAASLFLMAQARAQSQRHLVLAGAAGMAAVSILVGPAYWSLTATLYVPENITMPYAGPELASGTVTPGMTPNQTAFDGADGATLSLEKYLVANYSQGTYLVVAQRANDVADFIVDTGLPAVAYGGFLGSDNAVPLDRFKTLVTSGKITYFLASSRSGGSGSELSTYVKENATLVDASAYGGSGNSQLYVFDQNVADYLK